MANVVGRERELSLAEEFLDCAGERFAVLVLEGEPGIGKTTVWREVIRRAEERSFLVLSCRPAETEAKLSLSALADLLEPVPAAALSGLPKPQRRALDVALLRTDPGDAVADRRTVATAVRSLLSELASVAPVLLAGDDVEWLDSASAFGPPAFTGVDTWTGTLVVPGLQFDLTAPTINGAVDKTVRVRRRAKRVRVIYTVTAKDDVDGAVPVTCRPASGTRFNVGRTRVRCAASDTSGNESTATVAVTVKRRR